MLETREFYGIMNDFEKYAKKEIRTGSMGLTKETKDRWSKQVYYSDGLANSAFKLFLAGYSLGKIA